MLVSIPQIALTILGILLLFLSFIAADGMSALTLMNAAMFCFVFAHLDRIEQKVEAIYRELMAYEIVEDDQESN